MTTQMEYLSTITRLLLGNSRDGPSSAGSRNIRALAPDSKSTNAFSSRSVGG